MNPDACKDVMDRSRIPYVSGHDGTNTKPSYFASVDELSLRKQLPLRQQADKPILKYNTSLTKAVHLFNPEETTSYKRDGSAAGVNAYSSSGMYFTGNLNIASPTVPAGTGIASQPSNNYNHNPKQITSPPNPYVRPVSATEIAANINGEKTKRMIENAAAVTIVSDKSPSPGNQSRALERNSFLRPLSAVSTAKDKTKQTGLNGSNSQCKPSENCVSIVRRDSAGSDSSGRRDSESKFIKDTMFQFASTTSFTQQNRQPSPAKGQKNSSPISQSQSTPVTVRNPSYSPNKPYLETVSIVSKGLAGDGDVSSGMSTKALIGGPNALDVASSSNIHESQLPSRYVTKQALSDAGGSLSDGGGYHPSPLKRMPVVNTLTGTMYYKKSSIPGDATESSNNGSICNTGHPTLKQEANPPQQTITSDIRRTQTAMSKDTDLSTMANSSHASPGKLAPGCRPSFERSNASAQLDTKPPLAAEKGKSGMLNHPVADRNKLGASAISKSTTNFLEKSPRVRSRDHSQDSRHRYKADVKSRSTSVKSQGGDFSSEGKENRPGKVYSKTDTVKVVEQRPMGDGAPSKGKVVGEKGRIYTPVAREKPRDIDEESDDDAFDDEDEEGEDDEDVDDEDGDDLSGISPSGERMPGDGEASLEDLDEDDDGLDQFEDNTSEGESDGYSINSTTSSIGQRSGDRPVTSRSTRTVKQGSSAAVEDRLKSLGRPATATNAPVIKPAFRHSLFKFTPPTLNFVGEGEKTETIPSEFRKLLKWKMSPITPIVVKTALARVGFRATKRNHDWLGCFGKHMKANCFKPLREYQKLNHFPGSFHIGRKDKLWRNLSKMQVHHGKREFNFFPHTYVLPADLKLLKRAWEDGTSKQKWIIKPPASARGIGIKVISKWTQIPRRKPVIVQKYLSRPYLINDSKFDMRVYVYISSYDPLRIYVYDDGLARFASCKYSSSMKSLSNKYMHLTNYSINKKNVDYLSNTDNNLCQGHKWSLKALWNYMKRNGVNTNLVWDNVRDLIVKTIICGDASINSMTKSNCRSRYICHELFGFDILLDENLKPWILEVNISPSLHSNSQLDINIKGGMIRDLMNIAGFRLPDVRDVTPSASSCDFSSHHPSNKYCMDKRLFTNQLSPDERAKHAYYCQKYQDEQIMQSILDVLTPGDIRQLCEVIDEDSRKGNFQRLFPTPYTHRYLRYFEMPRYFNLLLDQWVLRYNRMEQRGIMLLQSFCDEGIHLENPTLNSRHQWTPPNCTAHSLRSQELRPLASTNTRGSASGGVALRSMRKVPAKVQPRLAHSVSSNSMTSNTSSTLSPSPIGPLASPTR